MSNDQQSSQTRNQANAEGDGEDMTDEQLWADLDSEDTGSTDVSNSDPDDDPEAPASGSQEQGEDETGAGEGDNWGVENAADDAATSDDGQAGSSEGKQDQDDDASRFDPKELAEQNQRLEHKLKSEQGRLRAARQELATLRSEIEEAQQSASTSKQDEDSLRQRKEKLEAAQEEYGDVIGPLVEEIGSMQSRLDDLSAKEKKDLDAKMQRFNTLTDEQEGIFTEEHPDGFDTIKENFDTFSSWIEDQPKRLRDIYAENSQFISDGTAAAFLVGKFKEALSQEPGSGAGDDEQGQPGSESAPESKENGTARMSGRRRRQMDGARHSSGGPNRMTSAAPAKDSDDAQAHWDHFERMDRQKSATG